MVVNKLPEYVKHSFDGQGIDTGKIMYSVHSDMKNGEFIEVWIAFDAENLYIMTGFDKVEKIKGVRKLTVSFEVNSLETIAHEKLDTLKVERFLSTARLISEKENIDSIEIASFTIGYAANFENFIKAYKNMKEGKDVEADNRSVEEDLFCPKCGTRYPESERRICPKCISKISITLRLFSFFRNYRKKVIIIILTMLMGTAFNLLSPYVGTKLLFDEVLTEGGSYYGYIGMIVLAIVGVRLVGLILGIIYGYILAGIIPRIIYDIKVKIFTAMQQLSVGFYTSKQTGALMARINNDSINIYWFFVDGLPYVIVNVVTCIGIIALMSILNFKLALITIVTIPIIMVVFKLMFKVFRAMHHRLWVYDSKMQSHVSDTINGQRIIKAFARENEEMGRFGKFSRKVFNSELKLENAAFTTFPLVYLFMFTAQIIVTALGGIMVVKSELTLGTLLTFNAYLAMLYGPMEFMSWVSNWWSRCVDSAQRVFEIVDAKTEVTDSENPIDIEDLQGEIDVSNVCFEYEPARPIIKEMSFHIEAGQMLGIVGKTGAGKSTIVNLIARLYDVKEGNITIDGVNIKDISLKLLRMNVGLVSQEIYLFMGTIADNIRYAMINATIVDVISAAKAASAHDFIMKLPDGYETRVGAGGQDLSGGEKQRLSIARTIIQNPKILILDEATAAMDTETERNIQDSLAKLKSGRTTIAIAHRLSTLHDADMLAVISEGTVVEYGTHRSLIEKKGEYYNLFKIQSEALKHIGVGD